MEQITKASQAADLLLSDCREAHKAASESSNGLLELLLLDVVADAARLHQRLEQIENAIE